MVRNGEFTRTNSFQRDEDRVIPRFHIEAVQDKAATLREGRAIYRDEERVEIIMPGNPTTQPVFKVTDEHRQRWPEHYERFKAGQEQSANGTPIEEWSLLRRSQVMELKYLGFATVEQLAQANDLAIQRIGIGGRNLVNAAQAFLDQATETKIVQQALAERDAKDLRIADLEMRIENMQEAMERMHGLLQAKLNEGNPIATTIPGMTDPLAQRGVAEPAAQSSLADVRVPRGRPRKNPAEAA